MSMIMNINKELLEQNIHILKQNEYMHGTNSILIIIITCLIAMRSSTLDSRSISTFK